MPVLPNGIVIPSFFGVSSSGAGSYLPSTNNSYLRVGEVIQRINPGDPGNEDGKEVIYIVLVDHIDPGGATLKTPYRCYLRDGFGAAGDHFRYSLRVQTEKPDRKNLSDGAIVLLLCINGDQAQSVIIACLRHPDRGEVADPKEDFLDFEFNGVKVSIDDLGALTLTATGATKVSGEPNDDKRDSNNAGSSVSLAQDGTITITDARNGVITISPKDNLIKVVSGEVRIATGDSAPTVRVTDSMIELGGTASASPPSFVALATYVEARLAAIEAWAKAHIHPGVMPGPSVTATDPTAAALLPGTPAVAATKVKAL